jgi:hypothetical protein
MTTTIFTEFLRELDASMGVQSRNILLFVDNCATHPQDSSFPRNVKVVYYPPNCTSVLQPLDLGTIKCFKQLYRKHLVQKAACLMDSGKDIELKINVLQAIHFTGAAWQQVTQSTTLNCFCQCGYRHELNTEADSDSSIEDDDAFHEDWIRLRAEKDVDFSSYISAHNELATCSISSIDDMCDDCDGGEDEEAGDECRKPEPVPSFTEAHTTFETVKSFFYKHSISEHDEQVILNLELALFHVKRKVSTKQLLITDLFGKKVIFTQVLK